jgi:hypothetical protein
MNSRYLLIAALAIVAAGVGVFVHLHSRHGSGSTGPVVHVENGFEFTAHGPYKVVAPLFGAWGERAWGGDHWKPQFLYPQPARDVPGEVFTVAHSHLRSTHLRSTWVNTALDLETGHIQYVYVIPDTQAVLIDIHLQPHDASATDVKVVYQRTALNSDLNEHVTKQGEKDRNSAQEWQSAIDRCLQANPAK